MSALVRSIPSCHPIYHRAAPPTLSQSTRCGRVVSTSRTGHRVSFTRFCIPHPVRTHGEPHLASARQLPIALCLVCRSHLKGRAERVRACRKKFISPARRTRRGSPSSKTTTSPKFITSARTNTPSPAPSTTATSPAFSRACSPASWTSASSATPSFTSPTLWKRPATPPTSTPTATRLAGRSDNRRNGNREAPTLEGTTAAPEEAGRLAPIAATAGRGTVAGRDRRDRGGNRDRQPGSDNAHDAENPEAASADFNQESDFGPHPDDSLRTSRAMTAEIGEGAPGADGSRRWRGRRGRRRGRPGQRDESAQPVQRRGPARVHPPPKSRTRARTTPASTSTAQPSSLLRATPLRSLPLIRQPESAQENTERRDRNDRHDRGDRGGRNDRRGGRDRDRGQRRAPRGFAPRTSLYGVDDSPPTTSPPRDRRPRARADRSSRRVALEVPQGRRPAPGSRSKAADPTIILPSAPELRDSRRLGRRSHSPRRDTLPPPPLRASRRGPQRRTPLRLPGQPSQRPRRARRPAAAR